MGKVTGIERGRLLREEADGWRVASLDRPGIVSPPLPAVSGGGYEAGETVYFFLFADGTGGVLARLVPGTVPYVLSVNGRTGEVTLSASDVGALPDSTVIPSKTSELTNDSGFVNAAGAAAAAPVKKVNNKTGDVTLSASDVGALPDSGGTVSGDVEITGDLDVGGNASIAGYLAALYLRKNMGVLANNTNYQGLSFYDNVGLRGYVAFRRTTDNEGMRLTAQRTVNGATVANTLLLYLDSSGKRTVSISEQAPWQEAIGTVYVAGDSVTFATLSYTQFAGGMRGSGSWNFTVPLSKPVAAGVAASVSGSVIEFANGTYHTLSNIEQDSNITLTVKVDSSGVTVHGVFATPPSWFAANTPCTFQAYGLTITFS